MRSRTSSIDMLGSGLKRVLTSDHCNLVIYSHTLDHSLVALTCEDGPDEMPNSVDARTIDRYRALGTIRVECYWAQSTPLEKGWASVTGHQPMPVIKVTEGVVKGRCIGHVVECVMILTEATESLLTNPQL